METKTLPNIKIAHITDLHVTEGVDLEDQRGYLQKITNDLQKEAPDLVLLTGDYYGHTVPHVPRPRERAALEPFLVQWADIAPVVVLEGNHDHGEALGLTNLLGGSLPIRIVQQAEYFEVFTKSGPVTVYALPYPTKQHLIRQIKAAEVAESSAMLSDLVQTLLKGWAARITMQRRRNPNARIVCAMHTTIGGSIFGGTEECHSQEVEVPQSLLVGMDVDYGALGHIHNRQEMAPKWHYAGNPWPKDFGEKGEKGWNLVHIGTTAAGPGTAVQFMPTMARRWITLEYRWAADPDTGAGRWTVGPTAAELADVPGNIVRMRLTVPDHSVAGCPWDAEVERITAMKPHRMKIVRIIEPTQRVRAPEMVTATTVGQKIEAYWKTTPEPPSPAEQAFTKTVLHELETMSDEQISTELDALLRDLGLDPA